MIGNPKSISLARGESGSLDLVAAILAAALAGMGALALLVPSLCAQSAPGNPAQIGPAIKVEVRIVLLDVVVTNKKGEPVSGLAKEQFEVMEDGVPQTISFLEEHAGARPAHDTPETLPANVYTSSQTVRASDSVNVLLLDWLNTQPSDQTYVRKQVIKYLRGVAPGTRIAIFTLGTELRLVQGFTTESAVILAALNDKDSGANPKSAGLLDSKTREASEQEVIELMTKNNAAPAAISAVKDSMATTAANQSGDRAKLTIQGLLELERYLSPIPGRKNVFWFAGSFPIRSFPVAGPPGNYQAELQKTAQEFGPARIAIYPISAEGVTNSAPNMDPSQGLTTRARVLAPDGTQETTGNSQRAVMEAIARETGGQAFYNSNGLDYDITRAVEEGAHYYTMTYSPTNTGKDGKFRNIQVRLAKENYKLSYRRGYYAEAANSVHAESQPANDPLLELMRFGMPDFDQIAYNVRVAPVEPQPPPGGARAGVNSDLKGPFTRYSVDFSIPLAALKLKSDAGGMKRGTIQLMLVAYEKNGNPLNLVESKNEITLKPEVYESGRNVNIHARQELDVPAGNVYLRVGIYERASGNVGTLGVSLEALAIAPNQKQ